MLNFCPLRDALLLKPDVEGIKIRETSAGGIEWLPQTAARILNVFLNLSLLPARGRIAEVCLEQVVTGQRGKSGVDLPRFAATDLVDRRLRSPVRLSPGSSACGCTVEDPTLRHAAQNPKGLG